MASGSGTNAENIIRFFRTNADIKVQLVLSNKSDAYVLDRARSFKIETMVFNRAQFYESDEIVNMLLEKKIDLLVLAGFLWLLPESLVKAFEGSIVNIHPALLPKYGGKGMYGMRVHQSVLENNETESGITIHLVNEKYDEGDIIFQERCRIEPGETPESLAEKVHELEYKHFPPVIEKLLK